ncbi:MAG: hypothetical protein PVH24_05420 [Candidatus Zixiibacteriota bacterium]|jgi:hypothetical protein
MNFPRITIWYAILLILLGIIGYFVTGAVSVTALIPAFFGVVFLLLGIFAREEKRRKTLMHIAAVLAVIAFFGSVSGIFALVSLFEGEQLLRLGAAISRAIMAILSFAFVVLAILSFVAARRSPKSNTAEGAE